MYTTLSTGVLHYFAIDDEKSHSDTAAHYSTVVSEFTDKREKPKSIGFFDQKPKSRHFVHGEQATQAARLYCTPGKMSTIVLQYSSTRYSTRTLQVPSRVWRRQMQ